MLAGPWQRSGGSALACAQSTGKRPTLECCRQLSSAPTLAPRALQSGPVESSRVQSSRVESSPVESSPVESSASATTRAHTRLQSSLGYSPRRRGAPHHSHQPPPIAPPTSMQLPETAGCEELPFTATQRAAASLHTRESLPTTPQLPRRQMPPLAQLPFTAASARTATIHSCLRSHSYHSQLPPLARPPFYSRASRTMASMTRAVCMNVHETLGVYICTYVYSRASRTMASMSVWASRPRALACDSSISSSSEESPTEASGAGSRGAAKGSAIFLWSPGW